MDRRITGKGRSTKAYSETSKQNRNRTRQRCGAQKRTDRGDTQFARYRPTGLATQSPNQNAIEHCWDYIRAQIKERKRIPTTDEEVIQAWEEDWSKIPIAEINKWIENLENQLRKVVECGGDNCFHG